MRTVSLELAKQLKEKGFPQESYFSWGYTESGEDIYPTEGTSWGEGVGKIADAPTAEEILERLPVRLEKYSRPTIMRDYQLEIIKRYFEEDWLVKYTAGDHTILEYVYDKSLAEAAAKMWLELSDNNLLPKGETE